MDRMNSGTVDIMPNAPWHEDYTACFEPAKTIVMIAVRKMPVLVPAKLNRDHIVLIHMDAKSTFSSQ